MDYTKCSLLLVASLLLLASSSVVARRLNFDLSDVLKSGNTDDQQQLADVMSKWVQKPTGSQSDSKDYSPLGSSKYAKKGWEKAFDLFSHPSGSGKGSEHVEPNTDKSKGSDNHHDFSGDSNGIPKGSPNPKDPENFDSTPSSDSNPDTSTKSDGASDPVLQGVLDQHNKYRARHGVAPLTWSSSVASTAQAYAQTCASGHSGAKNLGENLAWGYRSFSDAVDAWYNEVAGYNYGGSISAAGHFTQMVWKSTKQLGCGYASCSSGPMYVCNYSPPGNDLSKVRDNVLPPSS